MNKIAFTTLFVATLSISQAQVQAQDWANLGRYADHNSEIMNDKKSISAVLMGNSITEGWSNFMPDFFDDNNYVNRGISGQTTPQMLIRFRPDVLDLNPEVVLILAGTNDIAGNTGPMTLEQIVGNIKSMAELADSNGIKVVLCSVLPAADYPWSPGLGPDRKIPALNKMIGEYAMEKGFIYLDYFTPMTDGQGGMKASLSKDGVHPEVEGYEIMAPLTINAVNRAMSK